MSTTVEVTNVFRRNCKATAKTVVNQGGGGSSKTHSLCQFFIFKRLLVQRNYKLLVLRKTRHDNKLSVYRTFIDLLEEYGLYNKKNHNKSDMEYSIPERNVLVCFYGFEDREKVKSTEWHDIWIEEASEVLYEDYLFLSSTRLYRGRLAKGFKPRIWLSFNPVECWIFRLEKDDDTEFIQSTYRDNPFANDHMIKALEKLKGQDLQYYNIYSEGIRGIAENLIFTPFRILDKYPESFNLTYYGLDFGYNHKTALEEINDHDSELYVNELIYESEITTTDIIDRLNNLIPEHLRGRDIYADSAEPDRIKEICDAGFNCKPVPKGPGSVKAGIDCIKRKKIYSNKGNEGINTEVKSYKWKSDKYGELLDEPLKFKDDAMAALRYAIFGFAKEVGVNAESIKDTLDSLKNMPDRATTNPDFDETEGSSFDD